MTLIVLAKYEKLMPFAKALAEGKRVEVKNVKDDCWGKVKGDLDISWYLNKELQFRIAPGPKLRPWTRVEALQKLVRCKCNDLMGIIIAADDDSLYVEGIGWDTPQWYLENCEQLDGSPCGVEIEI